MSEVPARQLKYIVVGTGRCGTVYMARLLTSLGIMCGHEAIFTPDGVQPAAAMTSFASTHDLLHQGQPTQPWFDPGCVQAEASWLAAPFLQEDIALPSQILHVVRHPLKVISSLHDFHFFNFALPTHAQYKAFVLRHLPPIRFVAGEINRAAYFYIHWNRRIEQSRPEACLLRIEDQPRKLLSYLGLPDDTPVYDNTTVNRWREREQDLTLRSIDNPELRKQLEQLAQAYDYPLA